MATITPPEQTEYSSDREAACRAALKPSFDEIARRSSVSIAAAAGPDMPPEFADLIRRAENAGWSSEEARSAIRALAHELLGAQGATFD